MCRVKVLCVFLVLCLFLVLNLNINVVRAEETQVYDYGEIDKVIDDVEGFEPGYSFEKLVQEITGQTEKSIDNGLLNNFLNKLLETLFGVIVTNKNALLKIIILAVFSATINAFMPLMNKGQVSEYAGMVVEILLITILAASFFSCCDECAGLINGCIDLYKAIIPVFFSAVLITTGNTTVAAYYEVILMVMTVVNAFYKNVFVGLVKMYFLLIICDMVTAKEQFSKMCELFESVIKIGGKATIAIFVGMGSLKGLINPMADVYKKNVVIKGLKLVPGIGGTVDAVSDTLMSASLIIKNGIGLAAIIVIISVCFVPILKLLAVSVMYKVTAAVIEPVAHKNIVKVVNGTGTAIGLLVVINMVVITLFVLMLAIMCVATNVGV